MQAIDPRAPSPMFALGDGDDGAQQFPKSRRLTPPPRASQPLFASSSAASHGSGSGGAAFHGGGMPRLATPTQVQISARGDDEVHPLAIARDATHQLLQEQQREMQNYLAEFGTGKGSPRRQPSEMSSLSSVPSSASHNVPKPSLKNFQRSHSDGKAPAGATPADPRHPRGHRRSNSSSGGSVASSHAGELTSHQQKAMDNFLQIQGTSDPRAKEELWQELVRSMKAEGGNGEVARGRLNRLASGGKAKKKDDILGVLKIGAADAVSIQSGLTEGWADTGTWNPSPRVSPRVSPRASYAEEEGGAKEDVLAQLGERAPRSVTPPNVPAFASNNDGLPLISPLSLGDDWGATFDENLADLDINLTGETTLASLESSTDHDESGGKVFFDIGKGFADNTQGLQGRGDTPPVPAPLLDWDETALGSNPKLSLADSLSSAPSREEGSRRGPPTPPLRRRPLAFADDEDWNALESKGDFLARANDGEVASFRQETDAADFPAAAFPEGAFPTDSLPKQEETQEQTPPLLDASSSSRRRKKGKKRDVVSPNNLSLEETILSVLQSHPDSHIVEEDEEEEGAAVANNGEVELGRVNFPNKKPPKKKSGKVKSGTVGSTASVQDILREFRSEKAGKVKSGTVGSTASAQDILRELRSETPCTLQSGNSIGSGNQGPSLPRSISIGKTPPKAAAVASKPPVLERNASPALAPSRRDLPRPNRVTRRGASEPSEGGDPAVESALPGSSPPDSLRGSVGTSTASSLSTRARGNLGRSHIAPEVAGGEKGDEGGDGEEESPLQRYKKLVGLDREDAPRRNAVLRGRMFPHTKPSVNKSPSLAPAPTAPKERNGFHRANPFDSPPRVVASGHTEDPFEEQSSPILPMEQVLDETNGSSLEVNVSMEPGSFEDDPLFRSFERDVPTSRTKAARPQPSTWLAPPQRDTANRRGQKDEDRDSPAIDEIRASISRLKHNGVGGVGKKTSTLVRNEATGRFVIRDVDDAGWREMMHPNAMHEGEGVGIRAEKARFDPTNTSSNCVSDVPHAEKKPTTFTLAGQLMEGSILDDDAVDVAVREVMECLSTTSSETKEEDGAPSPAAPDDEEDFFVIRKPAQDFAQWNAFGSLTRQEYGWDRQWGGDDNDSFAPGPEWDCDDVGGEGVEAGFGGGDGDGWEAKEPKPFGKKFYPSPTSVMSRRRLGC